MGVESLFFVHSWKPAREKLFLEVPVAVAGFSQQLSTGEASPEVVLYPTPPNIFSRGPCRLHSLFFPAPLIPYT